VLLRGVGCGGSDAGQRDVQKHETAGEMSSGEKHETAGPGPCVNEVHMHVCK
jgi:hypothetical protein